MLYCECYGDAHALLVLAHSFPTRRSSDLDDFYDNGNVKSPNNETLAIKVLANYKYSDKNDESFNFLKSISINNYKFENFDKIIDILKIFIKISPDIEPIRLIFNQIKSPINSKKYKIFIDAEFNKKGGSAMEAEHLLMNISVKLIQM